MNQLDPHLEILLQEFMRVCPETGLKQDDWRGLYEICLFAQEHDVAPPARTLREYLCRHGCSLQKATFLSNQYGHLINILKLKDERKNGSHSQSMEHR